MSELLFKDESFRIIGACFEVYNTKGFGFTEPVYQVCLQHELELQGIPFVAQPELPIVYKGKALNHHFKPDFICFNKIIVEIKAVASLTNAHRAQTLNYLHTTGFQLGLLINFGEYPKLRHERVANSKRSFSSSSVYDEIASWLEPE